MVRGLGVVLWHSRVVSAKQGGVGCCELGVFAAIFKDARACFILHVTKRAPLIAIFKLRASLSAMTKCVYRRWPIVAD